MQLFDTSVCCTACRTTATGLLASLRQVQVVEFELYTESMLKLQD